MIRWETEIDTKPKREKVSWRERGKEERLTLKLDSKSWNRLKKIASEFISQLSLSLPFLSSLSPWLTHSLPLPLSSLPLLSYYLTLPYNMYQYILTIIQSNLRIADTLVPAMLSVVERLSLSRRLSRRPRPSLTDACGCGVLLTTRGHRERRC